MNKSGMHEDEYYSFYSSNRTDGLWLDGEVSTDALRNEIEVIRGQGFNFPLVKQVQSWDVHPPVYYFLIHLICSLTPEKFSMWQGLIINVIALTLCLIVMLILGNELIENRPALVCLITVAWGISAATLTAVAFIRMYMLLTLEILLVTLIHVKEYKKENTGSDWQFYIELGIITFLGFMTHYYFFIWLFFLAVFFNLALLIRSRKFTNVLFYGLSMIVTFGLCYLFYPAWPAQMFRGQRGAQATGNFFDLSNTWDRLCFFAEKINRIGFGGTLIIILPVLVILGIWAWRKKTFHFSYLLMAWICYFAVVSKTALMYEDSSIRYQMPVLGVAYIVVFALLLEGLGNTRLSEKRVIRIISITGILIVVVNIISDLSGNISFLYPEEKEHIAELNEYTNAQMVYVFEDTESWCIWDSANEMLTRDKVIFVPGEDLSLLDETAARDSKQIILYVDTREDKDSLFHHITTINDNISTFEYLFSNKYSDVYIGE